MLPKALFYCYTSSTILLWGKVDIFIRSRLTLSVMEVNLWEKVAGVYAASFNTTDCKPGGTTSELTVLVPGLFSQ